MVSVTGQSQPSSSAVGDRGRASIGMLAAVHTISGSPLSRTTSTSISTEDPSPDACNATGSPGSTLCGQQ